MQHCAHVLRYYWIAYYTSRPGTARAQRLLEKYLEYKKLTTEPWI